MSDPTPTSNDPARLARGVGPAPRDRTHDLPTRSHPFWPRHSLPPTAGYPPRRAHAGATAADLRAARGPYRPTTDAPRDVLLAALHDVATLTHDQPAAARTHALALVARHRHVDLADLVVTAVGVGDLLRAAGLSAPTRHGEPALDALADRNLPLALDTYLARAHVAHAEAHSTPDLPRLLLLTHALHHGVPADILFTIPARLPPGAGGAARDDLVGWHGAARAFAALDATVRAAAAGRDWLTATALRTADDARLALGVTHLTHPALAAQLATNGPAVNTDALRAIATRAIPVTSPTDLSHTALQAVCHRHGWLLGTPAEQTHLDHLARVLPAALGASGLTELARGHLDHLTELAQRLSPTDAADRPRGPDGHNPAPQPHPARPHTPLTNPLLDDAARAALAHFAGYQTQPHPTRTHAFVARYPRLLAGDALHPAPALLATPPPPAAAHRPPRPARPPPPPPP
ncbi:hypothetical protein I6A94_07025, partial [Frankia sp. CN4]|nr:hypothetical protein [Frankia nepalensis]